MSRERRARRLTVTTRASWPTYRQVPQVRMCGAWLAQAGFTPGTFLDIEVHQGLLVIKVAAVSAKPPDPEVVRRAVADLRREYARRFPKRPHKL
jgi:hypothetical protein